MKNIFSKTTEKRTQNGLKTDSKRTNYGIRILIFAFLTLGFGQAWADNYQSSHGGFWQNGGVILTWNKNGATSSTSLNYNAVGSGGALSTITTGLTLTQVQVKGWNTDHYGNICEATVFCDLYKGSTKIDGFSWSTDSKSWSDNNCTFTMSPNKDFLSLTTGPGNYSFRVYAKITGADTDEYYGDVSFKGCTNKTWWYNKESSSYYEITFTIPSKNLTVAGAADGNTVSGSVSGVTKGTAYTITATPTAGYAFSGWTKTSGGSSITIADASSATTTVTFNDYSSNATVTANFVAEETHDITVSYKCGTGIIKTATIESAVGVTTARNITAPAISGFTFSGWTVGSGVKNNSASTTTNPINVNSKASGSHTLTANYTCDWELSGSMDSWGSGYSTTATNATTVYADVTLSANTDYSFKFKNGSTWYGVTGAVTNITYTNKGTARAMTNTAGGSPNQTMTSAGAGTYRFTWDITNKKVTITYPTSYKVELEVGTVQGNKNALKIFHTDPTVPANQVTSGNYVAAGTRVYFWAANGAEEATICKPGYNWWGFFNNAAGDEPTRYTNNIVSMYDVNPITSDMHVYAVFGENDYTVKMYNNGNGDVYEGGSIVTSTTAHVATASNTLTATPQTGYYFTGWDQFSDSLTINSPSTASTTIKIKSNKLGNNARLRANFSPRWSVLGSGAFGGWSAYDAHLFDGYTVVSSKDVGYNTITLDANTTYEIKTYDRETSTFYGGSANQDIDYAHSGSGNEYTIATTADPKSVFIHSAAAGSYTLNWNLTDKKIAVVYPTSLFITSGQKTEGQDDNAGGSFTAVDDSSNDVKGGKFVANNASVTFSATPNTGYTFGGWYSNATCTTPYIAGTNVSFSGEGNTTMVISGITTDKTVYAKFVPKTYTVTLTLTGEGYGSGGDASATATFNATLPSATMPTAAQGYAFMGFYSAANGEGRQFINPSGEWVANADDTISDSKWILDGGITLYAYYKEAQITGITFTPGNIVAPGATVSVTATIEPTPVGPTTICWRVLYSNDNPLDPQPTFTPVSGGTVSFPAHSASGSYKVEATLRKGTGCGGEEIHTFTAPFQVAGDHTVTVQYKCGDVTLQASKAITGKPLTWSEEITPDDIFGYTFEKWVAGDGVSMTIDGGETTIKTGGETTGKATTHAVQIKAIYDGKLTAKYTKKSIIYFKNTLGWSNVYVNIMSDSYWDGYNGSGNKNNYHSRNQQMTLLEGTDDIYYLEYSGSTSAYMSFTSMSQDNYENFWAGDGDHLQVVYPTHPFDDQGEQTNYGYNAGTPMFVPTAGQTPVDKHIVNNGRASYYNKGHWRKYDPIQGETGYTLKVYDKTEDSERTELKSIKFVESDVPGQLFKAVANLEAAGGYGIKFERDNSMLYTNAGGHLRRTGDVVITDKQNDNYAAIWIKATAAGDYTFAITINGDGKLCIQAEFPVATNDYRVIYTDNDTWTKAHTAESWIHPSRIITAEENAVDTISFFVSKGHSPEFKIQQVNEINETTGAITWTDVTSWTSCNDVDASGVYNFIFTQDGSKNISFTKKEPYTGEFYIRTNCAGASKWDNYRGAADHTITYSEYSITHGGYSHYFTHWVEASDANSKNVKFCIANDYSPCISDTLIRENNSDPAWANINNYIDVNGNILRNANVRFMWNQSTNKISRAYVDGAQGPGSNNFLYMLSEDNKIRKADESALDDHKVFFSDNENWIYEANIQAQPNAAIKLLSNWGESNKITQYFKGTSSTTEDLIDGSGENWYNIRLLYDFKTNRLVAAMVPTGNIDDPTPIHADVMFIREHQGDIDQLTFTEDGSITDIETAYAVMRFNKWTLNNKEKTGSHNPLASPASIYERSLYYVSFPFRVKLSEVFGFGTYGQHWIIQRYRGDLRAQQGYWAESAGFWEFIWNRNGEIYLEPDQGYILTLETELLGENSDVWGPNSRSSQIELFFPSYGTMPNITNTSITQTLPAHKCTINRAETEGLPDTPYPSTSYNRTIFDSHWNIMSVPTYVNANNPSLATTSWLANDSCPKFLYTWNPDDNTLTATSGTGFMYHAMHAYTVQYYGNVTWTTSVSPAAAPQRNTEYRGEYEFCLEVQQDEQMIDRTFVRLSDDENVTTGFEFGEDMTKQFNSRKANIFTIAGNTSLGGNSLPLSTTQTTVVPVGVSIKSAGDYTFAIPEGTEGIGVTLVDNETGTRTSLSALDYTVTLQPGDYTGRFVLEISPIQNTPTGLEEPTSDSSLKGRAQKVMIDGILYIVKDGKMYDARGARVE